MDLSQLIGFVGPFAGPLTAVLIGVATFVVSQQRATRAERVAEVRSMEVAERSAAKDTVEILAVSNKALQGEIADLRGRISFVEQERKQLSFDLKACTRERTKLSREVGLLSARVAQATSDIRDDVAANTALTERTADRANAAYEAANSVNEKIAGIGENADARLTRLEDATRDDASRP